MRTCSSCSREDRLRHQRGVAGIVAEDLCREILETHLPEHTTILAPVLWDELINKRRERFGLRPADLPVLGLYRQQAEWCEPVPLSRPVCRDLDDDWVLATAVTGRAEAIVTGDRDLLSLKTFCGNRRAEPAPVRRATAQPAGLTKNSGPQIFHPPVTT